MNFEPVNACLTLAVEAEDAVILTVEGLPQDGRLDPVQQAIMDHGATQCGFCTPGILLSAKALLDRNPSPSEWEIKDALRGNLCRCTGYLRIIRAIQEAAAGGSDG
jgi:carbon-monoxide dehydrogenase small subunit